MKKRPHYQSNESAQDQGDYTPGRLPRRKNTVTAAVLADMLEGKTITGMEAVFNQSTTRAAAVIFYLESEYEWEIERRDMSVGTSDGRVACITAYWLPLQARTAAFDAGARGWVDEVRIARSKLRKTADECKAQAARINALRKHTSRRDPRQYGLWGEI